MRARRVLAATGIAAAGVVSFAAGASAHNKVLSATCEGGLVVNLTQYNAGVVNTVKVIEDAATLADTTFGVTYQHTFPNLVKTVAHSYHVTVTAGDGAQYGLDQILPIPACQTPATTQPQETTTSPASTTTPPTSPPSTAPPSTVAASTSSPATTVPSTEPSATTTPAPPASSSSSPAVVTVTSSPATGTPTTRPSVTTTAPGDDGIYYGTVAGPSPHSGEDETATPGVLIHVERDTSGTTPATLPATGSQLIGRLIGLGILLLILGGSLVMIGICISSARSDRTVE